MSICPDELAVGRRIVYRQARGTIHSLETVCVVAWDSSQEKIPYTSDAVCCVCSLLCCNCDLPLSEHANNGKCLYAPTSWE